MNNYKEDDISCEKHRPIREYSHTHELIDNLPYMMMILLGAVVLFAGFETSFWKWFLAGLYILYGIGGAFWIIIFVCPYCHFFDTRACPCGYGQIAAKFRSQKDGNLFMEKFKKNIPAIFPLWIVPVVAGVVFLASNFSLWMLGLIVLFAINSFIILPLVSTKYGCAHCPQRDTCPWMRCKKAEKENRKYQFKE